jgi:hypothetical protein
MAELAREVSQGQGTKTSIDSPAACTSDGVKFRPKVQLFTEEAPVRQEHIVRQVFPCRIRVDLGGQASGFVFTYTQEMELVPPPGTLF